MRLSSLRHPVVAARRARVVPRWVRRADRRADRWVRARRAWHPRDRWLRRLSHTADRGRLWFAMALGLVVVGKWRAGARGIASLTLASVTANLLGKRLFGGPRPVWRDLPGSRRLDRYPTSPSFPSGHAASAAAFATGVALESPAAGALVAPVAAAVAYSRVHVRAHWASDVVGGVAIGAAVAGAGAVIVRSARNAVTIPLARVSVQPRPEGDRVLIVTNSDAGTAVLRPDPRRAVETRLPRASIQEIGDDRTLDDIVAEALAASRPPAVLGVLGGDGSVSRMADHARRHRLPLLVLAGGTFNHFAKAVGVGRVRRAIDGIARGGAARVAVGTLRVDGTPATTVLNTASIGVYPEFVAVRERFEPYVGKWVGALVAGVRVLRHASPIEVVIDGDPARIWSAFAEIRRGEREGTEPGTTADGDVVLRILHARGGRIRAFGALVTGGVLARIVRAEVSIETRVGDVALTVYRGDDRSVPYAHDGEIAEAPGDGPYVLRIAIADAPLDVIVPRR